jgi:ABC-type uncharacterized transport system substrate-binding protein
MTTIFKAFKSGHRSVVFLLSVLLVPVSAHPHLFIDIMAKFMFSDSTLSGVNIFWDMDEMYSASLMEEFDLNKNGTFEKSEYTSIYKEAFSYAANSNYFMVVTWGESLLQVAETKRFVARILPDKKIRYSFFVPLNIKLQEIADDKLVMFFNDPSMFVAFDLKKNMITPAENGGWKGTVSFEKEDYYEMIVLKVKRKP